MTAQSSDDKHASAGASQTIHWHVVHTVCCFVALPEPGACNIEVLFDVNRYPDIAIAADAITADVVARFPAAGHRADLARLPATLAEAPYSLHTYDPSDHMMLTWGIRPCTGDCSKVSKWIERQIRSYLASALDIAIEGPSNPGWN